MGKSLELMGLAAFNIFIALILSAVFLTKSDVEMKATALTESNVALFINETAAVAGGERSDMDQFGIIEYFTAHIADNGTFTSMIEYTMPDMEGSSRTLEMNKMDFISHILQGMGAMERREAEVRIEYIDIADNGKRAQVTTTNYERGVMPIEDGMGEARNMPVTGTSYCEQEIVLSSGNVIQMAAANCSTNINFSDSY